MNGPVQAATPAPARPMTWMSAASAAYGRSLTHLLRSAARLRLVPGHPLVARWIVHDLGLTAAHREALARDFPWVEVRAVDLAAWPPHVARLAHSYAWKPLLIRDAARRGESPLLWLDSANLLHQAPDEVARALGETGLYLLSGQTALGYRCDPLTIERMGARLEILDEPEYAAGAMGFDTSHLQVAALVERWAELALRPEIICPRDPRLDMHKPEQAVLTLLVREEEWQGRLAPQRREIDVSSRNPVRWFSSRNKIREEAPAWTDGLRHLYYATYKCLDRAWLRLDHLDNTRLGGWRRWLREHFTVFIGRGSGRPGQPVRAPRTSYYADPFLHRHGGQLWLLVEEYRYTHNQGRLLAMPLDDALQPGPAVEIESGRGHASFPFVFEDGGRTWLMPETCERRCIDVLGFDDFPRGARLHRRLMHGVDAADSVLFEHEGRWWLITSLREAGLSNRFLAIFHAPHWDTAQWTPHPVNAEKRHGDRAWSFGRCAGPLVRMPTGEWLRPIHASEHFYGEKVEWRRISRLDVEAFHEEPCDAPPQLSGIAGGCALHHICGLQDAWACDSRDRGRRA